MNFVENIYIYPIVFIISIVFHKLLCKYSNYLKLVDIPNSRSMHKIPKSRGGGIGIFLSFMLGIFLIDVEVDKVLILALFLIFSVGLFDDYKNLSAKTKFFFIGLAVILLYFNGYGIYSLGIYLEKDLILSSFIALPFFIFAIVGFVNAMNLVDGLDGLASSIAIVILFAYLYLGFKYEDQFLFFLSSILILSLSSFLIFNWYPSKIFMGDSGSLTLGFIIAILSVHSINKEYITPITVLLLTAVPILDTLIVMTRRARRKQSPFKADKTHMHHIILKQHYNNVPKTTILLTLLQAIFTYIGLGFKVRDDAIILVVCLMLFFFFYLIFTPNRKKSRN